MPHSPFPPPTLPASGGTDRPSGGSANTAMKVPIAKNYIDYARMTHPERNIPADAHASPIAWR